MTGEQVRLQVNEYDLADLRSLLGDQQIEISEEKPTGAQGELVTVVVILVTPIAIKAIAAWLLKQRRKRKATIRAEKVYSDGSRETIEATVEMSESTSSKDVIEQLGSSLNLDPELVTMATSLGG
jgi:hypothetical protein